MSVGWGSSNLGDWGSSVSWLSVGNWGSDLSVGWLSVSDWGSDLGDWSNGLDDSWGRTVNNSVESVDWVSSVGDGTDSTIGLNKGVLSLDNISVAGFLLSLGVSGQTVSNRVSVAVLWVWVVWLSSNDGCNKNFSRN